MRRKLLVFCFLCLLGLANARAQAPAPDFSATPTSGCGPLSVQFTDLSTNNPTAWKWDFGNGQTSTLQNPAASFATAGSYTVTLFAYNSSGANAIRKSGYITVYPAPTPIFVSNLTLACIPANIQFTDQSTPGQGSITSWLWTFGDGTTSTQQNPSHIYTQTGYYNVGLQVTNSGGCTNAGVAIRFLRTVNGVEPNFSWNQTSNSCTPPYTLNFLNQTSGPGNLTYNWSLGTNAVPANSTDTNPSNITYPTAGTYTVNLQVNSSLGCNQSMQQTVTFGNNSAVLNGPAVVCVNTPATFSNGSTPLPVSSTWDFGDGTGAATNNPSKTFSNTGSYNVKLVNKYASCADSTSVPVSVVNPPVPAFTSSPAPAGACKPSLTVNFTDQTTPTPTAWLWDFGDGQTSTAQNPSHTYTTTGSFNVKLTVTNAGSCSNSKMQTALVKILAPTVTINNANSLGACVQGTGATSVVTPTAAVVSVDPVATYNWTAPGSNEGSSTSATPSFSYAAAGNYTINVTVTTAGGCTSASASSSVQIGTAIPATFTISPVGSQCGNNPVTFTSASTTGSQWYWDFGDGKNSGLLTSNTATHVYKTLSPSPYMVSLILTSNGCPNLSTQTYTIKPTIPNFGYTVNCPGTTVSFSDSTLLGGTTPTSYTWDFGDGTPAATVTAFPWLPAPHAYSGPGSYPVVLTVNDGSCTNAFSKTVLIGTVNPSFSQFPLPTVCKAQDLTLTSTTTVSPPLTASFIADYIWQVGTNPPVTGGDRYNVGISYNGDYPITLTVKDVNGCTYTSPVTYVQVTSPTAQFVVASPGGCKNAPVVFTDQSIPYPGNSAPPVANPSPITSWIFDFGNGTSQTFSGPPFSYSYPDTGTYTVNLTLIDADGCTDFTTQPVQITSPIANFSGPDSFYCPGVPLTFADSSKGYGLTYSWNFGDGQTSAMPVNTYATSGQTYNVNLTVTDKYNCTNSITKTVKIEKPVAAFDIADTTAICVPLQTEFTAHGQYYDSLYWDFGDGTASTLPVTSHFYNDYGIDTAKLFVQGPGGCLDSASRRILLLNPIATTAFSYSPLQACDSVPAQFAISPPAYSRFTLTFGDNSIDSSQNGTPFHMYRNPNIYSPSLTLTDPTGCIVFIGGGEGPITVLGATPFFSPSRHAFCDSSTVSFNDFTFSNDGIASETYNFGDGSAPDNLTPGTGAFDPIHFYGQPGNFLATLKVTTNSSCTETYSDTIKVYQTPHPAIATTGAPCAGLIQFDGSIDATQVDSITWQWDFGNGQTSSIQNPLVRMAAGQYTVTLNASVPPIGCHDTTSKSILVNPVPVISGPHAITTPLGIPVTIPFTYSSNIVTYNWTPTANLDCPTCPNPVATLLTNASYTVDVTDANNCTASDTILITTICNDKNYFLPNTFTPNGDGVNDYFYPRGTSLYNIQSLTIFNRWGQMVFQRRNFPANAENMGWDGTFNGHPAPADAYVYIAEVICDNSQVIALHGNVTLIR